MSGLEHWLPSHDSLTGTFVLLLWATGVVTALVIVIGVMAFREFGVRDTLDVLLRGAAVLIVAVLAWAWLDYSVMRDQVAERRALDARAAELTARAIAPGSALACLDAVGNEAVGVGVRAGGIRKPTGGRRRRRLYRCQARRYWRTALTTPTRDKSYAN